MTVSRTQVTDALRDVFDPELGMSVVDLGLVYDVQIDDGRVRILMTLTTQGCPLHDSMTRVGPTGGWEDPRSGRRGGHPDLRAPLNTGADGSHAAGLTPVAARRDRAAPP